MSRSQYTDTIHVTLAEWNTEERTQVQDNRYALWCKPGQHSFDPDDPDQKTISVKNRDGDTVSILTCGDHLQKVFELASPKDDQPSQQETENDE